MVSVSYVYKTSGQIVERREILTVIRETAFNEKPFREARCGASALGAMTLSCEGSRAGKEQVINEKVLSILR